MHIGLLFDYPQGDGGDGLEHAVRLGVQASGADLDAISFARCETLGHPSGTVEAVSAGFDRLVAEGVDLIVGPSISDNCLGARDAADRSEVPAINYSGGGRYREVFGPATSGYEGTLIGFGVQDHAALKGQFLVLRAWRGGRTVQVDRTVV